VADEAAGFRLPEPLAGKAREFMAGNQQPVTPRDAATVMLLRDGPSGRLEVYMLRRKPSMAFAAGAMVFPGGSVDPRDADEEVGWAGPDAAEWGRVFDAPPEHARALVCAAVRETFEEAGVLLAGAPDGGALAVPAGPSWDADRAALAGGALTMAELLSRRGLVLRADLLVPWARWITPQGEPRRFDARFFAAALPGGQQAVGHEVEAEHVAWLAPASAIEAAKAGEISLLPPTAATLNELGSAVAAGVGLDGILGTRRAIEPICPRLVLEDGKAWLVIPDTAGYPL
jgi:8-oxo-dGTP pyrophosphatase MutT (NUDIX family)